MNTLDPWVFWLFRVISWFHCFMLYWPSVYSLFRVIILIIISGIVSMSYLTPESFDCSRLQQRIIVCCKCQCMYASCALFLVVSIWGIMCLTLASPFSWYLWPECIIPLAHSLVPPHGLGSKYCYIFSINELIIGYAMSRALWLHKLCLICLFTFNMWICWAYYSHLLSTSLIYWLTVLPLTVGISVLHYMTCLVISTATSVWCSCTVMCLKSNVWTIEASCYCTIWFIIDGFELCYAALYDALW